MERGMEGAETKREGRRERQEVWRRERQICRERGTEGGENKNENERMREAWDQEESGR